jgi:hypothetical protein
MLFVSGYNFETPPSLVIPEGIKPLAPTGARKLHPRTMMFYSQYVLAFKDADKQFFNGARSYRLTLPPTFPRRGSGR